MTANGRRLLVHDGTFAVLAPSGDIAGTPGTPTLDGLFRHDTRHLSRWQLTLDGAAPAVLVPAPAPDREADCRETNPATAVLTPPATGEAPPGCTLFREQAVAGGVLTERIRVVGNDGGAAPVRLSLTMDADFADQLELRSPHHAYPRPEAARSAVTRPDGIEFHYRRGADWHARTVVTADPAPVETVPAEATGSAGTACRLSWLLEPSPQGAVELRLRVAALPPGAAEAGSAAGAYGAGDPASIRAQLAAARHTFVAAEPCPSRRTARPELAAACERGLADLAELCVTVPGPDGAPLRVPGAGAPWFLALFGRDSLLTSFFALPYRPGLAEATLLALAATQAGTVDPERGAEPGKIVHEVRHGELAAFGQVPYGRYYGSVDSTPLFLVLLGAYAEQQGAEGHQLARRLEPQARAAVEWMFGYGGLDDLGYLACRPGEGGPADRSWKDSPGAVCAADGTVPAGAVMVAEVQGYAYDALCRTAELARAAWGDPGYAGRLERAAAALRERFGADFWLPDRGFPPLALDESGRRLDALASDAGHLLWSGILGQRRGETVGRRLLEPDFFSGWGVRTLAAGQAAHHPLSCHRGSIWPQDNALIALGLARYSLRAEAARLAEGLLAAAARCGHRLPEVLAGYDREEFPEPVPYPHTCSPRAWAAATPLALLTALSR
ncbi:aminotransferase [Streptomyces oryzae]|uniref:Aminotransferase n=1 Tax=Streptomyces oryzae TaxID=1434886 RepID=A0ABS3X8F3_9ACTN|nr:glycogen debranching N-terminal domain-containing protein [Streptomyces oryzae]MBO8191651.1 aminotransferase [Streptomyces oryzae]